MYPQGTGYHLLFQGINIFNISAKYIYKMAINNQSKWINYKLK